MTAQEPARSRSSTRWAPVILTGVLSAALASAGTYAVVTTEGDPGPVVAEAPGAATAAPAADTEPTTTPAVLGEDVAWRDVAEQVAPSTVAISASGPSGAGSGSGVVWDEDGHVVTNAHVVAGAREVTVTLSDGRGYRAEVVGTDAATDLAVLELDDAPEGLVPVTVGDDEALAVGDPVMAVGNPLGLSGTVTTGIVSALDRPVTTQSSDPRSGLGQAVVTNAIQTSAPINPGNSGGALVDASGALVGINSSIASLSAAGGQAGNIGIGFAIPVGAVTSIAGQLIEDGTAEHAFLGVALDDARGELDGALITAAGITRVEPGSPADGAGLQEGDIVLDIDGERVDGAIALVAQVRQRTTGDEVVLGYVRDGERQEVTVTLDARPDER